MSHVASPGPLRTPHPHPPAPSRPVLQASGAAPDQGNLRRLAARLLAAPIERIARADARLERLLAAALHAAVGRGPSAGGSAGPRRVEEVARAVGLDVAELRELVRFDRALGTLTRLADAYDRGTLSRAKLMALLPMATLDTETIWLERAERYDAIALGAAATVAAGPAATRVQMSVAPGPAPSRVQTSVALASPAASPAAAPSAAPARVQLSVAARPGPRTHSDSPDAFPVWMDVTAVVREALRPLGHGTDPAALAVLDRDAGSACAPLGPARTPTLFDDLEPPAGQRVDAARLRELVARRQSVEWRLGRLLATMRRHALHRALGFASLEAWAAVVAGLPPARIEALLAIDALVQTLVATEDAFRRGRVSLVQARLIERAVAVDPRREREWLRRAMQMSVDRLEAMVRAQAPAGGTGAPRGITSGVPVTGSVTTATSVS